MVRLLIVLGLALTAVGAAAAEEEGEEARFPVGTSAHGGESGPSFVVHVPESFEERKQGERWPVLVALHEVGGDGATAVAVWKALAEEGRYLLLCPKAGGIAFAKSDLAGVIQSMEAVRKGLPASGFHLAGVGDAGYQALSYALSRPREFGGVVAVGTDVPEVEPASGASRLRVLVLKRADDRPGAGRESVEAIREEVEVAEFRDLQGAGSPMDAASRAYAIHFLDAASGRCVAGRTRSLPWRDGSVGMSVRKARKLPALVYFWDAGSSFRKRTESIQLHVLFDAELRAAVAGAVPILAPRSLAAKLIPGIRLSPGPSIVVLDREGKVAGVVSKKPSARAICALLRSM